MTHTLVSFLGKVPKERGGQYKTAHYHFEDGYQEPTSFFGLALQHYLKPDRLVILGTTGSMWDVLIEILGSG
jgi:hypothetical protein